TSVGGRPSEDWKPWERDVNNFPISRWLGNSAIVPFGKNFVKDDLDALLESRSILPAGFVYLVEEAYLHLQSGGRFGFGHVVLDGPQRVEDHSSTRAGQMREQAVLNRIVLRTVRRVMGQGLRITIAKLGHMERFIS